MSSNPLSEKRSQQVICSYLKDSHGYEHVDDKKFDIARAIYAPALAQFVQETQPDVWTFFNKYSDPVEELLRVVSRRRNQVGTLALLQDGIPSDGSMPRIVLFYATPTSSKAVLALSLSKRNRYTVMDEVHFQVKRDPLKRLDIVICVNGIAIITGELKNELTGQGIQHAEAQYKTTRDPIEPLLSPFTGALVHFAISTSEVSFTTVLDKTETIFLPFNRGRENGAGNPDITDEYGHRTAYLWQDTWSPESLGRLISNYMMTEEDSNVVVFPRFHQLDLLNNVRRDLRTNEGCYKRGGAFLIEHSAGSGKTKSIGWLAHDLASAHDANGEAEFDAVIVVCNRRIIDAQLQKGVEDASQTTGLVGVVTKDSKELAKFLKEGKRIIVCTIQKFSFIEQMLKGMSKDRSRRYAVIFDEAHSGVTGEHAAALTSILSDSADETVSVLDEIVAADLQNHGVTIFAFTATPREATLERFTPDGKAYHTYSMQQAIEEGFILNPIANYTSHELLNTVSYHGTDTVVGEAADANRSLRSRINMSAANLDYKVETVLTHMVDHTLPAINGFGRGMVVAASRMEAYKWYMASKAAISANPAFAGVAPLVAFSGSLSIGGVNVTDASLNGMSDSGIPAAFKNTHNLLIVAEKFQTGFNEPNLVSEYIDRTLKGVTAVQTLSRLNRTQKGKTATSVIDFADNAENVREAFARYGVPSESVGRRNVTEEDLLSTASQIVSLGIVSEAQAANYDSARRTLAMDPDNANAIKTARDIVLASGDRMNRLLETDKKRLDIFRTVAQEYLEDYIFRAQYARISRPQLSGLYQLLKVVLRQVSRPRVNSSEWLDQIDIQLVEAQVTERDFSDLAGYASSAEPPTREPSNTGAPILSKTITLSELVATWNERLSTMVRESVKSKPATSGSLVNAAPSTNDQYSEVFTALAQIVVADPIITGYAEGKSQDRFSNNCEVRQLVHEKIMLTFIKAMGASPIALEVLGAYTRDEKGFKTQLQDFLLHCIYQEVINNALNVPNVL